jgi:hypothetical protein
MPIEITVLFAARGCNAAEVNPPSVRARVFGSTATNHMPGVAALLTLAPSALIRSDPIPTGAVVASAVLDSRFGLNRGFDFYYDHFDFNRLQESNLEEMERPGNVVADQALDWLSKNSQKRFFLWMHLYDPHRNMFVAISRWVRCSCTQATRTKLSSIFARPLL